jgi:anti-sigma B factor antagonist
MATPLQFNTERGADGTPRVVAVGEIDLSNVDAFTKALDAARTAARSALVVDLGAVRYVDSAGINALFALTDHITNLRIIVHPVLVRVLTVSGLTELATVEPAP